MDKLINVGMGRVTLLHDNTASFDYFPESSLNKVQISVTGISL